MGFKCDRLGRVTSCSKTALTVGLCLQCLCKRAPSIHPLFSSFSPCLLLWALLFHLSVSHGKGLFISRRHRTYFISYDSHPILTIKQLLFFHSHLAVLVASGLKISPCHPHWGWLPLWAGDSTEILATAPFWSVQGQIALPFRNLALTTLLGEAILSGLMYERNLPVVA